MAARTRTRGSGLPPLHRMHADAAREHRVAASEAAVLVVGRRKPQAERDAERAVLAESLAGGGAWAPELAADGDWRSALGDALAARSAARTVIPPSHDAPAPATAARVSFRAAGGGARPQGHTAPPAATAAEAEEDAAFARALGVGVRRRRPAAAAAEEDSDGESAAACTGGTDDEEEAELIAGRAALAKAEAEESIARALAARRAEAEGTW